MKLNIDTTAEFELKGNRKATLDLGELQELQEQLYKDKGTEEPLLDNGQPVLGPDQKPLTRRTITYADVEQPLIDFVKQKGGVELSRWEARALWDSIASAWEKKRRSWRTPDEPRPTSPPSTGPMSWD